MKRIFGTDLCTFRFLPPPIIENKVTILKKNLDYYTYFVYTILSIKFYENRDNGPKTWTLNLQAPLSDKLLKHLLKEVQF
jgi:hypothetical protein